MSSSLNQPNSYQNPSSNSTSGGATAHEQSQWMIKSISDFNGEIHSLRAEVGHLKTSNSTIENRIDDLRTTTARTSTTLDAYCSDMTAMKTQIDSMKRTIWVATGALAAAVIVAGFFLGGSIQDVLSSLDALKSVN